METVEGAQPLSKEQIEQGLQQLPALPAMVLKLLELTQRDDVDVDQVARAVAQDPALSTRLLRVANSPFFGLAGEITSINQGCMTLGMSTVRNLAVAVGMSKCFNSDKNGSDEQRQLWRQAMDRAIAAQALARCCGHNSDTAFTAGMLHDLGKMVMVTCFSAAMEKTIDYKNANGCELAVAESAIFGMDNRKLGGMLASHWGLPVLLQEVIAGQHEATESVVDPMIDIVTLANFISQASVSDSSKDLLLSLPDIAVKRLGLNSKSVQAWLSEIEKNKVMADLLV